MSTVAVLETAPFGRVHALVGLLCLAALISDGLDMQLLGFAAPLVLKEWAISSKVLAPAMAAALIGMAAGAWIGGFLGDRLGRRMTLIVSVGLFGLATAATAMATGVPMLTAIRFASGVACGAAIPNALALVSEWVPLRYRTQSIGILVLGTPIGGMLGAELSSAIIESAGWRVVFVVSGAGTIVLCLFMAVLLPDSLEFLVRKGRATKAQALLARALPGAVQPTLILQDPAEPRNYTQLKLFSRRNLRVNLGLCLAQFASSCAGFIFLSWLTTLLSSVGVPLIQALKGSSTFLLACIVGTVGGTMVMARLGSRLVLFATLICAAVVVWLLRGQLIEYRAGQEIGALLTTLTFAGVFLGGVQSMLFALVSSAYAPAQRASGIGLATGFGRVGAFSTTLLGGALLSLPSGRVQAVLGADLMAIAAVVVGLVIVDRHTPPRSGRDARRKDSAAMLATSAAVAET